VADLKTPSTTRKTWPERFGSFFGLVLGLLVFIGLPVLLIVALVRLVIWLFQAVPQIDSHAWSVLGETVRNTSGLLAFCAALVTVTILHRTNKARAREAASSDFRDQMQWACERLAGTEDEAARSFALMIISKYAQHPGKLLSEEDQGMAREMMELANNLTNPDALVLERGTGDHVKRDEEGRNDDDR
jgi:flagellar biosynthesis protein FliQ